MDPGPVIARVMLISIVPPPSDSQDRLTIITDHRSLAGCAAVDNMEISPLGLDSRGWVGPAPAPRTPGR